MRALLLLAAALVAAVVAACDLLGLGAADQQLVFLALSRSQTEYVVTVATNPPTCYALAPGAYGRILEVVADIGEGSAPRIRLLTADGRYVTDLGGHQNRQLFVVEPGDGISVIDVEVRPVAPEATGRRVAAPSLQAVDGQAVPPYLPLATSPACN